MLELQKWLLATTITVTSLAGLAWYAYSEGETAGETEVQSKWDKERMQVLQANAEVVAQAFVKQAQLEVKIAKLVKDQSHEKARISADYKRIIAGLHDRPDAAPGSSTGMPETGASGFGCTGAGLARRDGEFLAGYSADAGRLQAALNTCRASRALNN